MERGKGHGRGMSPRRWRPGTRRYASAILAVMAVAALLTGCAALGAQAPQAGQRPDAGSGGDAAGGAKTTKGASEVAGVSLAADRERYRPGEAITLTVRNDSGAEIQLTGGLGGLKAWRVDGGQRRPWEHGMMETGALVPVPAGQSIQLGPIPAPEEPGEYVLEVHFYHQGGGPAAASVTVRVAP
ncbi:hypothetical protein DYI95_004525 [Thermaerobacter sp. PB12/4term]|uniref:hypothetical protein n=1 Tax=Thermaerobacter sp. PB12/4term TaxID=2293838 RepID=UPI000E326C6D|nr:hypothetical protein [Thermaerobacter sp. PB12/4term]QIA26880.1 hypothetical protein DYI95_004525 [Thermaerobacter sp. PB12/4term]